MNLHNKRSLFRVIVLIGLSIIFFNATAASNDDTTTYLDRSLKTVEIVGISIETPSQAVAGILEEQGYTQINETLYTKQAQLNARRKTIFRIEIEDTAAYRQITYHRSLSGGRVKSSVGIQPIPAFELDTVRQLYQLICENEAEAVKSERSCESSGDTDMAAGHGRLMEINERWAVQLTATASNTAIGIKYTYE